MADQRCERGDDHEHRCDDGHNSGEPIARIQIAADGQGEGAGSGGADAPDEAAGQQSAEVRRERRAQGTESVEDEAGVEHRLAVVPIRDRAVNHLGTGKTQEVHGDREGYPGRVGSETEPDPDVREGGKRHVDPQGGHGAYGGRHGDDLPLAEGLSKGSLAGIHVRRAGTGSQPRGRTALHVNGPGAPVGQSAAYGTGAA